MDCEEFLQYHQCTGRSDALVTTGEPVAAVTLNLFRQRTNAVCDLMGAQFVPQGPKAAVLLTGLGKE